MMNPEPTPVESVPDEAPVALPFSSARWGRILYGLFITIMPPLAFWATNFFKPEWQNGDFESYITLLLFPVASVIFFVLIGYSIVCYWILVLIPERASSLFLIRFGIYTGVLLTVQYCILSGIIFLDSAYVILLWVSPIIFPAIHLALVRKLGAEKVNTTLIIMIVLVLLIFLIATLIMGVVPSLFILAGLTMASPFWCFLIFLSASVWLFKNHETKLTILHGVGLATWLSAYIVAWRFDILKMYQLYAALPPQPPPDCYIATAAAKGHPQLVHSWNVIRPDGTRMQVNKQLQVLKLAELALLATNPRLHGFLRRVYDMAGKWLARGIQNPFAADVAYLLLKPWEWLAERILEIIVPEIDSISKNIYAN